MNISRVGNEPAICFAFSELCRYLKLIQKDLFIKQCIEPYKENSEKLYIGICPEFDAFLPEVKNKELDDGIYINVVNGSGIISGTNPRSVLIAVYRFLKELGAAWVRPGPDGEILPNALPETYSVQIREAAAYRHRAICIEGAISCDHVRNMIDWIPKASMNGYYTQFFTPFTFFDRWYTHLGNPTLPKESFTYDDSVGIQRVMEEDIAQRGLIYYAVGHGWTCKPLGMPSLGWYEDDTVYPDSVTSKFALINGKRELWKGLPLNTQLCYSNPEVQELMSDAVLEYCKSNPNVDYVAIALADGENNHCECEECQKKRLTDFYIMILNKIDSKLTAAGLSTKVTFTVYVDLLWPSLEEKILNEDRFVLKFCPITRTYTKKYADYDKNEKITLPPYVKNKLVFPQRVEENVAFLKARQASFGGDCTIFDYHLMWDHMGDPGYYRCAEILFADAQGLDELDLNGFISCQLQRAAFPSGLPLEMMATGLWNKKAVFEEEAKRYFKSAFGKDGEKVRIYLETLSREFVPPYARGELPVANPEVVQSVESGKTTVRNFQSTIEENIAATEGNVRQSWIYLKYHTQLALLYGDLLIAVASGNDDAVSPCYEELLAYTHSIEMEVHNVFDVCKYGEIIRRILTNLGKRHLVRYI